MIYLLETELLDKKPLHIALNNIFGIGKFYSKFFCKKLGFSKNTKVFELTEDQKLKLVNIKSYRGLRKLKGFPVRGQRTRSNARTAKKLNK